MDYIRESGRNSIGAKRLSLWKSIDLYLIGLSIIAGFVVVHDAYARQSEWTSLALFSYFATGIWMYIRPWLQIRAELIRRRVNMTELALAGIKPAQLLWTVIGRPAILGITPFLITAASCSQYLLTHDGSDAFVNLMVLLVFITLPILVTVATGIDGVAAIVAGQTAMWVFFVRLLVWPMATVGVLLAMMDTLFSEDETLYMAMLLALLATLGFAGYIRWKRACLRLFDIT